MAKILLSAFADEYSKNIDTQIELCRQQGLSYIEPRFIHDKNIADLTAVVSNDL